VHLLPYHRLGESKYSKLGKAYSCEGGTPDQEAVENVRKTLASYGLEVQVGG
jgi:pyruvate formate lyase activating enzyme